MARKNETDVDELVRILTKWAADNDYRVIPQLYPKEQLENVNIDIINRYVTFDKDLYDIDSFEDD